MSDDGKNFRGVASGSMLSKPCWAFTPHGRPVQVPLGTRVSRGDPGRSGPVVRVGRTGTEDESRGLPLISARCRPAAPRSGRHEAPSALETCVSTFSSPLAGPQSCPRPSHPHLHKGTLGAGDVKSKERVFFSNCGGNFKSLKSKEHPIIFLRPISGRKAPVQVRGPGGQAVSPSTVEVFAGERERREPLLDGL